MVVVGWSLGMDSREGALRIAPGPGCTSANPEAVVDFLGLPGARLGLKGGGLDLPTLSCVQHFEAADILLYIPIK